MALQIPVYCYSSRRLKSVTKQQKAKATVPLWYELEMGRDSTSLVFGTDSVYTQWVGFKGTSRTFHRV